MNEGIGRPDTCYTDRPRGALRSLRQTYESSTDISSPGLSSSETEKDRERVFAYVRERKREKREQNKG